jgi:hypothetical protein
MLSELFLILHDITIWTFYTPLAFLKRGIETNRNFYSPRGVCKNFKL